MKKLNETLPIYSERNIQLSSTLEDQLTHFLMMWGSAVLWDLHAIECVSPANLASADVRAIVGKKYVRFDVGNSNSDTWSGRFMADIQTGEIFGVKAYGVPNKGRRYGTLASFDPTDLMRYRDTWERKGRPGKDYILEKTQAA